MKDDLVSKQQFIRLIHDATNNMSGTLGSLGTFLLERAKEINAELVATPEEINEEALVKRIKTYRIAEDNQNLVWMDYNSWNGLSEVCRGFINDNMDPLFWTGVFFKYDEFIKNEEVIVKMLDVPGYLYLLSEHKKNFYLAWVTCENNHYNWLNNSKMIELSKDFNKRMLKSYGMDGQGNVVIKVTPKEGKVIE